MDFDEYEYLEKTVENPHLENEVGNGGSDEKAKTEVKERSRSSRHRSDEKRDEDEDGRRSKRSRSHHRSRSRDRERDRHRSSREHRDKERGDRDREKDRDKEERNGKDREKDKDKDRDSKGRDHEKDKERDRSRRSISRSERHRSQEREKSQEIEIKERDTKERDRDRRRHKDKKEDKVEPEADPERDQRTVFAYQIALRATERDVYEFFSRAGKVRDVRIIMDRISRRSRGIGYVEFYDTMSVPMAIALSGQPLLGQPVMVKPSEAEKNLVQSTTAAAGAGGMLGPYSGGARRLYVGNLHVNMSEDDLRKVFESFGSVELVQVPRDETGHCKGFGFVQFARLEDARNALNLNGQLEIAGRAIKVSAVTDQTEVPEGGQMQNTGDLDDDDGSLSLNAQSRALLMQKLDRSGTASSTGLTTVPSIYGVPSTISPMVAPPLVQGGFPPVAGLAGAGIIPGVIPAAIDPVGVPSECLLLKNMFDPSTETEPEFDLDIKEDVTEECSKFGNLKHIFVDKNSVGFVYLRFENAQAAMGAQRALHGRWFAGKMITATFMTTETYEAKFPESK